MPKQDKKSNSITRWSRKQSGVFSPSCSWWQRSAVKVYLTCRFSRGAQKTNRAVLALVLLGPLYAFNCVTPEWFYLIQPSKGTVLFRDLLLCCVCSCLRRGSEGNARKTIDWASRRAQAPIHWRSEEVQTFEVENNNIVMKIYLKPGRMFVCYHKAALKHSESETNVQTCICGTLAASIQLRTIQSGCSRLE